MKDQGRFVQTAQELLNYDYTEMNRLLSTFLDEMTQEYYETEELLLPS